MINLNDHIKLIDGIEYVPLSVVEGLLDNYTVSKDEYVNTQKEFDSAMEKISTAMRQISTDINNILKDD